MRRFQISDFRSQIVGAMIDHRDSYHGCPNLDWLPQRHEYRVVQSPERWFGFCNRDGKWLIPRNGLHTDQGSIPAILTPIVPSDAYWAFLIHDDLYQFGKREIYRLDRDGFPMLDIVVDEEPVTREQADLWLYDAMKVENQHGNGNWLEAWLIYKKVHRWGFVAWNKHNDGRRKSGFKIV